MEQNYTFLPLKSVLRISHLVSLFYNKSPRNFCFDGESHDFWEFIYIDQGKMLITAGDKQYVLRAGELAFHKPGEFHAVCAYEQVPSNFIVSAFVCMDSCMKYFEHRILSLNSRERNCLYEAVRLGKRVFAEVQTPPVIPALHLSDINTKFGDEQLIQANLELLLLMLLQRDEGVRIQPRVESYAEQARYKQLADCVKAYLEAHLDQTLTLSQIASDLGYSVSQMKKLFQKDTGGGIIDYFIGLKIDEAKRLIREGNYTLTQIAERLGYENPSYFSRLFKQREDMTPSEYGRSIG